MVFLDFHEKGIRKPFFKFGRDFKKIPWPCNSFSISITWKMRRAGLIKPLLRIHNNKTKVWSQKYATEVDKNSPEWALDPKEFVDFKRQLRQINLPHKDGHTCLQLECRLCERNKQPAQQRGTGPGLLAYVNKRTGTKS